jgi:hypothetical protein
MRELQNPAFKEINMGRNCRIHLRLRIEGVSQRILKRLGAHCCGILQSPAHETGFSVKIQIFAWLPPAVAREATSSLLDKLLFRGGREIELRQRASSNHHFWEMLWSQKANRESRLASI